MSLPRTNGCGAQDSILNPPDLAFKDACDDHDLAYHAGGTPKERRLADRAFLSGMKASASAKPWYLKAVLYPAAYVYWASVRLMGWRRWGKP